MSLLRNAMKLAAGLGWLACFSAQATAPVVLVHGANLRASSWAAVQQELTQQQVEAIAPDLYSSVESIDLAQASQRLCSILQGLGTPAIVVGHSQGGAIATEAAGLCPQQFEKLVYLTAVLPLPGEGTFDDLSQADNDEFGLCGTLSADGGTFLLKTFSGCAQVFMNDQDPTAARKFWPDFANEPTGIGNSKAAYPADKVAAIPKYYITTSQDRVISPATQQKILKKASFREVFTLNSSHTPFFSMPDQVTNIISHIEGE